MATEVILPRIDSDMTEGTIREWKTKEGDRVDNPCLWIGEEGHAAEDVRVPERKTT